MNRAFSARAPPSPAGHAFVTVPSLSATDRQALTGLPRWKLLDVVVTNPVKGRPALV